MFSLQETSWWRAECTNMSRPVVFGSPSLFFLKRNAKNTQLNWNELCCLVEVPGKRRKVKSFHSVQPSLKVLSGDCSFIFAVQKQLLEVLSSKWDRVDICPLFCHVRSSFAASISVYFCVRPLVLLTITKTSCLSHHLLLSPSLLLISLDLQTKGDWYSTMIYALFDRHPSWCIFSYYNAKMAIYGP